MRNLLNNISTIGTSQIGHGIEMLAVRNEALRTLCAQSLAALAWCASWTSSDVRNAMGPWITAMFGHSMAIGAVPCCATVKQPVRQRQVVRYRSVG